MVKIRKKKQTQSQEHYNSEYNFVLINENYNLKRLDVVLSNIYSELSRSRIQSWILDGHVFINGQKAKSSNKLKAGQTLEIFPPALEESDLIPEDIPLNIIHEDSSIIIIDKHSPIVVHPGAGNFSGTILNGLLFRYPYLKKIPRAGIVHRLDKDTTGLMIVAKTLKSHDSLVKQLAKRSISRRYLALSWGKLHHKRTLNFSLARDPLNRLRFCVSESQNAKHAETEIIPLKFGSIQDKFVTLIECILKTGRTHQIRVHLEHVKLPIIGDETYKKGIPVNISLSIKRQALHAKSLIIVHPETNKEMSFYSKLPLDIKELTNLAGISCKE